MIDDSFSLSKIENLLRASWDAALASRPAVPAATGELIAETLIDHTRLRAISGDCSCGVTVALGLSFAAHQAEAIIAALASTTATGEGQD